MFELDKQKPGFLPQIMKSVFTPKVIDNTALDIMHYVNHLRLYCNMDVCKKKKKSIKKYCRFDPRLGKHRWMGKFNDQCCEQCYSKWGPKLAPIMRTATEWTYWWLIYVFRELRNERIESLHDVLVSGMCSNGGYLPKNWIERDI